MATPVIGFGKAQPGFVTTAAVFGAFPAPGSLDPGLYPFSTIVVIADRAAVGTAALPKIFMRTCSSQLTTEAAVSLAAGIPAWSPLTGAA